ncbi:MBL fold metallo-hydrolase [Saccharomonospora saliphila]|uniref:MBL fold metallo-hydrolase n=1 Tax=Saccharomonospora saliphila TaxID=369829 RepID=UPI00035FD3DB|nr:MBL fold metallo-hydrolase [Saccharomonospora saliphila]
MIAADLVPLSSGVYAYVQPDGGWCLNNAGVVVGAHGVVLVDTAASERRARRLRDTVAATTDAPVRTVVNTHFHGDHTFGNCVFADRAEIVAHERARVEMQRAGLGMQMLWPEVDWGEITLALPTVTYTESMRLHTAETEVELFHPGPAHTTNDTVVWLPAHSVLFAGDVLMNGATPFCLMGSVTGSLRTIDRLRALKPRTVVPGHGPVGGPEILDANESYLLWLRELAAEGVRAGRTPMETARAAVPHRFGDLLDSERLVANLHRAYAEVLGASEGAELDVEAIFGEMVTFHGGLPPCHA